MLSFFQSWVIQGSEKLWLSTGRLAYISQVTILLPQAWTNIQAESSGDIAYEVNPDGRT